MNSEDFEAMRNDEYESMLNEAKKLCLSCDAVIEETQILIDLLTMNV